MTITKNLTANTELSIALLGDGTHVRIENRGDGVVYASKYPDIVAGADNVIAIDGGVTKLLTDVCTYGIQDSIGAYRGNIYLLADSDTSVEITTTNNSNFKQVMKGGDVVSSTLDDTLRNGRVYQIGVLTSDITLTLPERANDDIEVDFAVSDTIYNINCDYLLLIPVVNTYYQIIFSYDKLLNTWFSSVVSNDYNVPSTTVEVTTDE